MNGFSQVFNTYFSRPQFELMTFEEKNQGIMYTAAGPAIDWKWNNLTRDLHRLFFRQVDTMQKQIFVYKLDEKFWKNKWNIMTYSF